MAVITISRQFGAGGDMVSFILAQELGFLHVNREVIIKGLAELGLPPQMTGFDKAEKKTDEYEKKRRFYLTALHEFIMGLAEGESIVLLGRGGQFLFRDHPDAFHIKVQAPFEQRVEWVRDMYSLEDKAAVRLINEQDRKKKRYTREVFNHSWMDMQLYDLVLNTGKLTPEGAAKVALQAFTTFSLETMPIEPAKSGVKEEKGIASTVVDVKFMHASEEEFAGVLDFYKIPWQYEPHTFPLQWDNEGKITEAFAPDFFLPEYNLYVELTTQKQRLVWKKNKKIRRLKELYPDVNIKIIYGKDYRSLLKKFGLDEKD